MRLQSGEQIDVEMQTRRHAALRPRVLFYWGRLYSGQLKVGQAYSGLKRCVVVLITDFKELPTARFHSVFQARERTTGDLLTDHLELHLLELPKLRAAITGNDEPAVAAWCRFLSAETDSEREALAMQHPILKDAKDALDRLSTDPDALEAAERRESELWFYEHNLAHERERARNEGRDEGRAEGRNEGRAEGRNEGKREALRRLLSLKFRELSPAHQARIAAGTDADLDRWLDRCVTQPTLDAIFSPE